MKRFELTYGRAKKLIDAWEGHVRMETDLKSCTFESSKCPIHKYFMELKKKVKLREINDG